MDGLVVGCGCDGGEELRIVFSGSGDSRFLGPKGDSGDIKFDGGGNTYKITVDIKAGVYTIVQQ